LWPWNTTLQQNLLIVKLEQQWQCMSSLATIQSNHQQEQESGTKS
jgi:hypothetical protein